MIREFKPGEWIEFDEYDGKISAGEVYEVESGEAELYIVYKTKKRRKFLKTVSSGDFFINIPDGQNGELSLLAIATNVFRLRNFDEDSISAPEISKRAKILESALPVFFCRPEEHLLPRVYIEIPPGEKKTLPAGTRIVPQGSWFSLPREAVSENDRRHFIGGTDILLLPASESVLLESETEVAALSGEYVIANYGGNIIKDAINSESSLFCRAYLDYFRAEDERDKEKLSEFTKTKELLVTNSYRELFKNLISDIPFVKRIEDKNQPPVVHAMKEIAEYFGIPGGHIKLREELLHLKDAKEVIRAIGSRELYMREIDLPDGWHKTDLGPLLVFRENGDGEPQPLAALPVTPDRYEYADLENGRRVTITDGAAQNIRQRAFCFYQAMPDGIDSLWKLMKWASKLTWKRDLWLLILCCLIAGLIPVITPLVTQTIFNDIIPSYDKEALLLVVQVMFVTSITNVLINLVRGITLMRIKNHIRVPAESALWLKLLSLPASFFRKYQTGDLSLRMQGIGALSHQLSSAVASGIFNGIFCFWNLILMFYYSYKMSLLAIAVWGIFLALSLLFSWRKVQFQRKKADAAGRVSGQLIELLYGLNKFKLRASEERAFYLWTKKFGEEWKWNRKSRWQDNWLGLISSAQPIILNFCVFYYAMSLLDMEKETGIAFMSTANFLSFNSAMGSFGNSLNGFKSGIVSLWGIMPVLERILPILQEKSEVSENKIPAGELSGGIEVLGVNFRYREDSPLVLKNINFAVRPGTFLAIVGSSGSGKSTLLRVMLGLETASDGAVLYDGQDIAELDISSVRRQIGVVMQHGQLMEGSIFSNIVGSLPLTLDDAWEVARLVGLEADIKELPMGMYTIVNEGGTTFSGGQRQRLLIARSLVHHPRIIVFDEATSALDNETQAIVSDTLDKMHATRIIVAHRLSTIRNADRILVMDRGEIVEDGTYDDLMAKEGIFSELTKRQTA